LDRQGGFGLIKTLLVFTEAKEILSRYAGMYRNLKVDMKISMMLIFDN